MRRWQRLALVTITLIVAMSAATALFGPGLLRDRATAWIRSETGRSLEVGKVSINLLAMSLEIHDVTLTETDQQTPFVTWQRLYLAFSPRSLWHRAPVIREVHLEKPMVRIEREAAGRFNFSDLLERPNSEPAEPARSTEPARFSLNNLTITGGQIDVVDRALPAATTHRIEGLELAVPFVGNLPYLADRYVQPLLRATVNGTPLELKGELKPFADLQEYSLQLKLDGIDLPYYLDYLPFDLPVKVHSGRLDVDLDLSYRASASTKPELELAGRLDLTILDLREPNGDQLLFLPLLEARLAPSLPIEQQLHLSSLTLHNLQTWIDRNPAGEWNVARLWRRSTAATAATPEGQEQPAALQLDIDRLRLKNGRLAVRDHVPTGGFATTLRSVNIDVDSFTLAKNTPFRLALDLASERQERLGISGQVTISPLTLDLAVEAKGVPLGAYLPYYRAQTTAVIGGELQFSTRLQSTPENPLLLSDTRLDIAGLNLPLANSEGVKLASAVLQGGRYDLAANRLEAADLALTAADVRFSRDRNGHWSFLDRSYPLLAKLAEPPAVGAKPTPETSPFSYHLGRIALSDAQIQIRDAVPAEPASLKISALSAIIRDLAAPQTVKSAFEVQGTFQKRGQLRVTGTAVPSGPGLTASVRLRRIPLVAFAPYIREQVRLVLVDGALDADLTAAVAKSGGLWRGRFGGDFGISRFYCLDAVHREDLLRWERLQVSNIDGRLEPFALKVATITLNDYFARVLLDEQARLNLAELAIQPPESPAESPPSPAHGAEHPSPPPAERAKPEIHVGKITLQEGKINFSDRHMPRPFSVEMLQVGGRIEGLSSTPGARAEVDLRGRLRNESPLTIAGTLNPLADPLFLDLKLDFNDIELSPLSPYSGTYVGYLIERGKLNVTLAYQVDNNQLKSSNKLFLDQFTFGDKVESDQATSLPVRLAVALLKDRNGQIHLDIPVYGDLDDPQFSIWGIIWQIIKNLLVKAATSPLALLGALAGGGEDFSAIVFPYGSASLTDAEQVKLAKIADALRDRTDLKIEVKGYVDPDQDPEGYRRELLQARIRREKHLDLRESLGDAAPADAAAVTVTSEEYPEYLWRVYKQADFPKPRNLVGMIKHLPDAELEKLLLANTRIGNEELTTLAHERAQAVVTALVVAGGIPRERVFLATTEITAKPAVEGGSRSRVEFGMAIK